jgi:hypothetical protein
VSKIVRTVRNVIASATKPSADPVSDETRKDNVVAIAS